MNKIKNISGYLLIIISFTACGPTKYVTFSPKPVDKIETIAFIASYIRIQQATGINIYVPIINSKTNSIAEELNPLFQEKVSIIRDSIADRLGKSLKCQVISGDALHNREGYNVLKEKYNNESGLATKNNHFPEIQISQNDFNPFDIEKVGISPAKNSSQNSSMLADICKTLNVNYLVVTYTLLGVVEGDLVMKGSLYTSNVMYLFDKDGECIATGVSNSPGVNFNANEPNSYDIELNRAIQTYKPIIEQLSLKFNNM